MSIFSQINILKYLKNGFIWNFPLSVFLIFLTRCVFFILVTLINAPKSNNATINIIFAVINLMVIGYVLMIIRRITIYKRQDDAKLSVISLARVTHLNTNEVIDEKLSKQDYRNKYFSEEKFQC